MFTQLAGGSRICMTAVNNVGSPSSLTLESAEQLCQYFGKTISPDASESVVCWLYRNAVLFQSAIGGALDFIYKNVPGAKIVVFSSYNGNNNYKEL